MLVRKSQEAAGGQGHLRTTKGWGGDMGEDGCSRQKQKCVKPHREQKEDNSREAGGAGTPDLVTAPGRPQRNGVQEPDRQHVTRDKDRSWATS